MRVFSFLRGHKIFKVIGLAIGGLTAAFVVLMIVTAVRSWWGGYQWQKKADKFQAEMERPYREDSFGGQTPEETWQMFLAALKQGDVEQASKYVAVNKRGEYKQDLEKAKQKGELDEWVKDMEILERDNKPYSSNEAYYSYKYFDKEFQKVLWSSVVFYLNPITKVWKILVL